MINLVDYILDKISDSFLFEMADSKSKFEHDLSSKLNVVITHYVLVKYISIKNDNDECSDEELGLRVHWCSEIMTIMNNHYMDKLKAGKNVKKRCIEKFANETKNITSDEIQVIIDTKIKKEQRIFKPITFVEKYLNDAIEYCEKHLYELYLMLNTKQLKEINDFVYNEL